MEDSSPDPRIVRQRTGDDCMVCVLAMFADRTYEEVTEAARRHNPAYAPGEALPHALLRRIAHDWGLALLSGIYMDWRYPGIVGVLSRTIPDCGHALYWDGERLIDPSGGEGYDRAYVDANAVEFTQRARDLGAVIALEATLVPAARKAPLDEFF